jgi:hypothetical protein
MGVVQHASAESNAQSVTVTLPSNVTEGNLIAVVIGCSNFNSVSYFSHDSNPSTSFTLQRSVTLNPASLQLWSQLVLLSEAYALTVEFTLNDGQGKHVHIFEVSGYDTADQGTVNSQTSTTALSVGFGQNTTKANEFVLAAFLDWSNPQATFTPGSGYTAGELTNTNGITFSMYTEYKTVSSVGPQSASATITSGAGSSFSLIQTFDLSTDPNGGGSGGGGGGVTTGPVFLGSVRVVGSAPAGNSNPFLGTVKVLTQVPTGIPNPYLGQVVEVASAPANDSNPGLGEVVVVGSAPAGVPDPFLGSVINT